jgi:anthranilate phosphoribosyltransferase
MVIDIKNILDSLVEKQDLSFNEAKEIFNEIMDGNLTSAQISAILIALRMKGETIDEIVATAQVLREKCKKVKTKFRVLDNVGTGGDNLSTFNISTTSSIVIASGGVPVAKHGNIAVSSKSGAADCLKALGVNINLNAEQNEKMIDNIGICFMYAPIYHDAFKYVSSTRKELGIRTFLNIMGPLVNPAFAKLQILGVYKNELVDIMCNVLDKLGTNRAIVAHGNDGSDEITLSSSTTISELNNGKITKYTITPEQFGLKQCKTQDLVGGDSEFNAKITKNILDNKEMGAKRDIVILNSAFGLYLGEKVDNINDGIKMATELLDSGKALAKLNEFIKFSNEIK